MVVGITVRVDSRRLLNGCSGGLAERTALIDLAVSGDIADVDVGAAEARIRAEVSTLGPGEPLFGVADGDWPQAFLQPANNGETPNDEFAAWLGGWVVAITVAQQRWARDPVWRGRVLEARPDRIRLAIPWFRDSLLGSALEFTVRLTTECCQSRPDRGVLAQLRHWLRDGLGRVQRDGLDPNSLRFIGAAVDRGIPFDVPQFYVQLGWGARAIRVDGSCTGRTSSMGVEISRDSLKSSRILADAGLTAPSDEIVGGVEGQACGEDHQLLVAGERLLAVVRRQSGTAIDITGDVHPDNRQVAIRAARILGLDIAGVDFVTGDITRSWREVGGAIRDVRAQPSFEAYWQADPHRDINGEALDLLLADRPTRIPTSAITGTNGKTTTSTMLHRIWLATGKCAGLSSTTGVRVGEDLAIAENLSGHPGARILLTDPGVEAAVLEMPRKGLVVFGHPCDRYDVAALLNVQDDHIGEDGIDTFEQMAELKAEILQRASAAIVVNADDPLCMAMRTRAGTDRHILVSRDSANPGVAHHRRLGGEAVVLTDVDGAPWIMLCAGEIQTPLMCAHDIPATRGGLLRFNQTNAMFAAALAWAQDIDIETIARALSGFDNTVQQAPGRYNFIDGLPFDLLVDFAHNPDGVREICRIVREIPVAGRRILCTLNLGNHHPAHFETVAPLLAGTFEEFVLSRDCDGPQSVEDFLSTTRQFLIDQSVDPSVIHCVTEAAESRRCALSLARPGDLLVILGRTKSTLPVVEEFLAAQEQS